MDGPSVIPLKYPSPDLWDTTRLRQLLTCDRQHQLASHYALEPALERFPIDLNFGKVVHRCRALYRAMRARGTKRSDAVDAAVQLALVSMKSWPEWDAAPEILKERGMKAAKNQLTLLRALVWYDLWSGDRDQFKTLHVADKPAVEITYVFECDGVKFCTTFDELTAFGNERWAMECKSTTSALDDNYFSQFKIDCQIDLQTCGARLRFKDAAIKGVAVEGWQVGAGFARFGRQFMPVPAAQLDERMRSYVNKIKHAPVALDWSEEGALDHDKLAEMRTSGCSAGWRPCIFIPLCERDPSERLQFAKQFYKQRDPAWNPLEPDQR